MKRVSLVDVCDFQGGSQPPKEEWIDFENPGYIRMLQIRDFTQSGKANTEYVKYTNNLKQCGADDILIGRYGASVGKILTGLSGAYNVAIVKTIPNESELLKRYLFHYLNSPYFQNYILSVGARAAQAGFNKEDLKNAIIPLPELDMQRHIAAVLDKASGLIILRKQQLDKLDELVKARFIELFGGNQFPKKPIREFVEPRLKSARKTYDAEETIHYIDISSIDNKSNVITGVTDYIMSEAPSRAQQCIEFGDILISTVRPNLRNIARNSYIGNGFVASSGFCVLRAKKCSAQYLLYTVLMDDFTNSMTAITTGANYPAIKDSDVLAYHIPIPPLELQEQFAAFVEQTDKSKLTIQQGLDKLETMKKALMQQYFG